MATIIRWCNDNQGFLTMILSIITIGVTIYVMFVSNRNSKLIAKKQTQQDESIALRQEDMQRRQIKVDTYPYRMECWETLYRLKNILELLRSLYKYIDISKLSYADLFERYRRITNNLSEGEIILSLEKAKNVFPINTWNDIYKIKNNYCKIDDNFLSFKAFSEILTEDEQKQREKEKITMINEIKDATKQALQDINMTLARVDVDLCIADLHSREGLYETRTDQQSKHSRRHIGRPHCR